MTDERERRILLELARNSIRTKIAGQSPPSTDHAPEKDGGAFVTLHADGRLRGCIGLLRSPQPLGETVVEMARSAAFRDPRFPPVTAGELADIDIEISLLSPFSPIAPEEVVVGTHGLYLRRGARSGLLLPQVPVEQGWDRETFLSHLCLKAGLPDRSWEEGDALLEGFTAEVFGETDGDR